MCEGAVAFQENEIRVDVVLRGHCVEYEMKTFEMLLHLFGIIGIDDLIRAEPGSILNFSRRVGEDHDMRAHCLGEFHAHVTKSAESHNADFLALGNLVMS